MPLRTHKTADPLPFLPPALKPALERAQLLGFLGDGPIDTHIGHALGFASALASLGVPDPGSFLDLGSGGGLPGLVLAAHWPAARAALLDSSLRRTAFLLEAVDELGWEGRVAVVRQRAEDAGRGSLRASQDLVVARSFGPPGAAAECAAPFLKVGGTLVVSEPPSTPGAASDEASQRWDETGLAELGLELVSEVRSDYGYRLLRQAQSCPDRFPRRSGVPAKRPLF